MKRMNKTTSEIEHVTDTGLTATVSSNAVDREGDVIDVKQLYVGEYLRNNIVAWAHKYDELPVGKAPKLWLEEHNGIAKLKSKIEWVPDSAYDPAYTGMRGSMLSRMYKAGFLSAFSVGILPLETAPRGKGQGQLIAKSELLDISAVVVPANSNALMDRAGDPKYHGMLKSFVQMCKGGNCSGDDGVYTVNLDWLDDVIEEEVDKALGIETTYLMDEDDFVGALDDVLNKRRR